jgi:CBS domain containing-hemolysin-like protein
MFLLFFYLALAICVSFLCSVAEAVLLSVRPSYVTALQRNKRYGAQTLARLQQNLDRPLAAILILNTVAHTVGAAGVGAQAAAVFGNNYVAATSAVLTLLILVLSEIIPKTLGAAHWQRLAPLTAVVLLWLTRLLLPLVWLSERLTRLLTSQAAVTSVSREEITAMAQLGVEEGLLDRKEQKIVGNLMRLHRLTVSDIMTPRAVIFMAPKDMAIGTFLNQYADNPFTRIPLFDTDRDDIKGYALKQEIFMAKARGEDDKPLIDLRRDMHILPGSLNASHAFDQLMRSRSHVALVVDEFGSVKGLLTLEDIMETLIGLEITDELDTVADMQHLARERWRERMSALGVDPKDWAGS